MYALFLAYFVGSIYADSHKPDLYLQETKTVYHVTRGY